MATFWPSPKPGDIVECRFPEDKIPSPGPKERPALVTNVETFSDPSGKIHTLVDVAYGTSKGTEKIYPGEFVINARHPKSGLTSDTKFDLGNTFRLNFDDEWFVAATPPDANVPPKRGHLDMTNDQVVKRKISSALIEAKDNGRLKTNNK